MAFVFEQRESDSPYVDQAGYADQPHLTRALPALRRADAGRVDAQYAGLSLV